MSFLFAFIEIDSDQLRRNVSNGQYYLILELAHVQAFDEVLSTNLLRRPTDILNLVRAFLLPFHHIFLA